MKNTFLLAVIASFLSPVIALADPAAAPAPKVQPATVPAKAATYPLNGKVVAITTTELTIKGGAGKADRVYAMTPETVIINGDQPATLADVKVDSKVGGKLEKSTIGHDKVLKLNIGVKQSSKNKAQPK